MKRRYSTWFCRRRLDPANGLSRFGLFNTSSPDRIVMLASDLLRLLCRHVRAMTTS